MRYSSILNNCDVQTSMTYILDRTLIFVHDFYECNNTLRVFESMFSKNIIKRHM